MAVDMQGNISNWAQDERNPAITASFSASAEYVAVWQRMLTAGEVIAARRWGDAGQTLHFDVAGAAFWDNVSPEVAANQPGYLVVYEGDATGDPTVTRHIYGRQLSPNEVLLPLIVRNMPSQIDDAACAITSRGDGLTYYPRLTQAR